MATRIALTQEIIYAAGADAANARARNAGRTYWTKEDYELAVATMNKLIACVAPETLRTWGWA